MHNIARIVKSDVKSLFANAMSVVIAIGLVVLPSLFAWYNVLACWDVFDNTGNLKVAVANTDEGYESDLMPLRVNVGDQVIAALRANDQIDWTFTTEEDAVDGARSGRYYAAVVIPRNFSRDMLTFYQKDAQRASIVYYVNEKKNAISPKITDQGADTVSYQVNQVFVETLSEISLGMAESLSRYAEDSGAEGRIAEVASHVREMGDDMDRAADVLELYASLAETSQALVGDTARLAEEAQGRLGDGGEAALQGVQAVASMADVLKQSADDLSAALAAGSGSLDALEDAVDGLFDAASSGSAEAVAQMRSQADALAAQAGRYRDLADALEALRGQVPEEDRAAIDAAVSRARAVADLMEDMGGSLRDAADRLEAQNGDVQAQHREIRDALAQARAGAAELQAEFDATVRPSMERLAGEVASLAEGAGVGMEGVRASGAGLADAAGSASALLGEAECTLDEAVQQLRAAASQLRELADGVDVALASGDADAVRQVLGSDVQALSKAIAAPVGIDRVAVFPVANFGSAMAPLYTALALFIGSLLILVAVKPTVSPRTREALRDPKPRELFLGHFGVMALLSLAQTTLMGLGNWLFLQVQVAHPLLFMMCFWLAGVVFSFLIYALVAAFANLGKAVAVLLLVVQVTGCGGSYPLQLLPPFVQAISPWLPATHVVNALRAAMFGTYHNDFWVEMGLLALFLIPAAVIGLALRKPFARFMAWYVERVESSKLVG